LDAERQRRRSPFLTMFPDAGPWRRELYAKHIEFFRAGAQYNQRLFMAANRVGKTVAGAFETACHLTGRYPSWWEGRHFERATDGWACGTTSQTTRDVVESVLLGKFGNPGMIPVEAILRTAAGRSISGSVETAWVRHVSGKDSKLGFKTYEQGRRSFEGEAKDFIWCDEEPPLDVYTEMLYRLLTTKGLAWTTFTPLLGMSEMVTLFLEAESEESRDTKYVVQAGWKDVPHLDAEEQRKLIANTPPYQIKARTEGEPALGAGAIYPIAESEITVPDRAVPEDWPRAYGMDVGWNRTAVVWGARDPGSGVIYLYSEHYQGQGEPASHAQAIRGRGDWIPGVIDPACMGSSQVDGRTLMQIYGRLGLAFIAGRECGGSGHHRSLELAGVRANKGDGEFIELAAGVSQIPPRRQGFGQDRETRRSPDGCHAVPDHQRAPAHAHQAATSASARVLCSTQPVVVNDRLNQTEWAA
jgi:phage terminase large subunit-like protein